MSDSEAPRRSQRERKRVKPFASSSRSPKKRKRTQEDGSLSELTELTDTDGQEQGFEDEEQEDEPDEDEDEEEEEEFKAPKAKKGSSSPQKGKAKAKGPPPAKKPRTGRSTAKFLVPKPPKRPTQRSRKTKATDDAFDAAKVASDTKITGDNPLFNAIMNPSAALQTTAEDFLESLSQSPGVAQAELINCVLRSCGCNDTVDADQVLDYDGVVDALDDFTEGMKQEDSPTYPLTSKLPVFKKFRKSLSELIERIVLAAAEVGSLYTTDLMVTLQTWVVAMSSSQIRSFRHTATVIALEVETALCEVAASVEKEAEVVGRQREGERKRKASSNKAGAAREKDLEIKAAEVRKRRTDLAEFIKEVVDGVFVHRYRDLDPNIRAECVRAMGLWFRRYPAHFLDASYLRYVGWVLSDSNTQVRLEAVKSLTGVYEQVDYIGSLNHFTERFKPRLIEMATGDTELTVRIAVIQVLSAIDGHELLEDAEREKLCLLVFDEENKVRKSVSGFVRGVWKDLIQQRLVGKKPSDKDKERTGIKALGILLVKWSKALDKAIEGADDESVSSVEGRSTRIRGANPAAPFIDANQKGRTALAVEALWDEVEAVNDWEALLDVLLLDHSANDDESLDGSPSLLSPTKQNSIDDVWRLQEVEESVLLEVLVATLRRAKIPSAGSKKGAEETIISDITRALIKGLPRLFIKYQTDESRILEVLSIPLLMNLDMYLEMRMINAYANLWDDVMKQFLSHSSMNVLLNAAAAVRHFMDATSLSNTNSTKVLELEDELSVQLRDAVAGRQEIEVASFSEDEVLALGAVCARLSVLIGSRDMTTWMEEDEGGKQSSAWDIISALVERGRFGYKEEEKMVEHALHLLGVHIIWKTRSLTNIADPSPDEIRFKETLQEQRDSLVEKLVEYAVGTQSNTADGVKRAAFQNLMNLHILFCPTQAITADGQPLPTASLAMELDDEVQYRCAGYIQSEIEQYSEHFDDAGPATADDSESNRSDSSDDEGATVKKTAKGKGTKTTKRAVDKDQFTSRSHLQHEYVFMETISTFLRAIRAGAVHVKHSSVLLAHHGRLGPIFDLCCKIIVDVLREEGMYQENGDIVVAVITQALRESFTLVLDGVVHGEEHSVSLSKQLASSFIIRGAQLSVVRRLDSKFVVQIHTNLLTWIVKRLTTYETNKNKKSRNLAILFFRVLLPLLASVESRDALKIKAHMDQIVAQSKIEIPPTSKAWEPQRAYEKRLASIMSKDKAGNKGRKAKGMKSAAVVTSDEEGESDGEALGVQSETEAPPRPQPKARPIPRPSAPSAQSPPPSGAHDVQDPNDFQTPTNRPRPRVVYGSKSPVKTPTQATFQDPELLANGSAAKSSRKRRRSEAHQDSDLTDDDGEGEEEGDNVPGDPSPNVLPSPQATPLSEVVMRRKRARH